MGRGFSGCASVTASASDWTYQVVAGAGGYATARMTAYFDIGDCWYRNDSGSIVFNTAGCDQGSYLPFSDTPGQDNAFTITLAHQCQLLCGATHEFQIEVKVTTWDTAEAKATGRLQVDCPSPPQTPQNPHTPGLVVRS